MNELNKKLAEWAGIETEYTEASSALCCYEGHKAKDAEGHRVWLNELPNFPQSLDACFKWLVPRLSERGHWVGMIITELSSGSRYTFVIDLADDKVGVEAQDANPALALCLAISKLIDSEK